MKKNGCPYRRDYQRRLGPYRSRKGMLLGVCRGLAEHFDVSVAGIRLAFMALALFTGIWPMVAGYVLAALMMRLEPSLPLDSDSDAEFYGSYTASRRMAVLRLKRTYDQLDRRIQRMESIVTDKEYDWNRRLNGGAR